MQSRGPQALPGVLTQDIEQERAVWQEVEANRKARKLSFLSRCVRARMRGLYASVHYHSYAVGWIFLK